MEEGHYKCAPPVELVEDVGFDGFDMHAARELHCISCRAMFDYIVCMCPRRPLLVSESFVLLLGFATADFFAFCLGRFGSRMLRALLVHGTCVLVARQYKINWKGCDESSRGIQAPIFTPTWFVNKTWRTTPMTSIVNSDDRLVTFRAPPPRALRSMHSSKQVTFWNQGAKLRHIRH